MSSALQITKHYQINTKIGNGGYSSVFRCKNKYNVDLACKILPKSKNNFKDVQNEISIMKLLSTCPKTVDIIDNGQDDSSYYIIQELCKGGDLYNYIGVHKHLQEKLVARIIYDVCIALAYMHDIGIIHKDIKESNLYITNTNDDIDLGIKLGDFGISSITHYGVTKTTDLKGTTFFMAPENLMRSYYFKSDVWSVGVLTYKLLSGTYPFNDRDNPKQPIKNNIWKSIYRDEAQFHSTEWKYISEEAKDFILRCLQHNTLQRMNIEQCLQHPWLLYQKHIYEDMLTKEVNLSPL